MAPSIYRVSPQHTWLRYNGHSEDTFIARRSSLVLSLALCSTVLALFSSASLGQTPNGPTSAPNSTYFDYDSQAPINAHVTPYGRVHGVNVMTVTFPSPAPTPFPVDNTVTAYYFEPDGPGRHPAVVVYHEWLPPTMVNAFKIAVPLAKAGIAALCIVEPFSLNRRVRPSSQDSELLSSNVPQMVSALRQAIIDGRRGLDWLSQQPEIDPSEMGASGVSLGGILAPLLAGVDRRARVVVAIDGGDDIGDLVWSSPFMRGMKPGLLARGETKESVKAQMAPLEPSAWLGGFDPRNAILFNGRYDVFVLPRYARDLARALGGAPIVWLNTGHYGLALSEDQLNAVGVRFMRMRFAGDMAAFNPPSIPGHTIKLGFLVGGNEGLSPDIAYQVLDFDRAGHYSLDGQLTLHGVSAALSGRVTATTSVGLELPLFHDGPKVRPFVLFHFVL